MILRNDFQVYREMVQVQTFHIEEQTEEILSFNHIEYYYHI